MLSAFILVDPTAPRFDGDRGVVKTLAALVDLVVSGVVADATIIARPNGGFARLDSIAGCVTVENADLGVGLAAAIPRARRKDALVLAAGFAPDATFTTEVEISLEHHDTPSLALLASPETLIERLLPSCAPVVGLVASCAALAAAAPAHGHRVTALRRALAARSMRARGILA